MADIFSNLINNAKKLSLGFVLVLIFAFLYLRVNSLFPVMTDVWEGRIEKYLIFTAFILAWNSLAPRKTERSLFEAKFLKSFWKLPVFTGITLLILYTFSIITGGKSPIAVLSVFSGMTWGVILFFIFVVAFLEEVIFRGWVINELIAGGMSRQYAVIISLIVFAGFHWWMGAEIMLLIAYIPLGLIFYWVKEKYSPKTNMANAGVHAGYDIWILFPLT